MKDALHHLNTTEIHPPDFDCDIYGVSEGPTNIEQELSTGPDPTSLTHFNSSEYKLPSPPSNRLTPEHIWPIPFQHSLAHSKTKMMCKVNSTINKQD